MSLRLAARTLFFENGSKMTCKLETLLNRRFTNDEKASTCTALNVSCNASLLANSYSTYCKLLSVIITTVFCITVHELPITTSSLSCALASVSLHLSCFQRNCSLFCLCCSRCHHSVLVYQRFVYPAWTGPPSHPLSRN